MGTLDALAPTVATIISTFGTAATLKLAQPAVYDITAGASEATPALEDVIVVMTDISEREEDGVFITSATILLAANGLPREPKTGDEIQVSDGVWRCGKVETVQGTDAALLYEIEAVR